MDELFQDISYDHQDYTAGPLPLGEYDNCTFTNCNFEKVHLTSYTFLECTFTECNFTNAHFGGTSLQLVDFMACKLLGADFSTCNPFMLGLRFRESILNLTTFAGLTMKGSAFIKCTLREADFTAANLSGSDFSESKLDQTVFDRTILEKCDFRTAQNFEIIPSQNQLKGARFSKTNLNGLVNYLPIMID